MCESFLRAWSAHRSKLCAPSQGTAARGVGRRFPICCSGISLEVELSSQLPPSRQALGGHFPKIALGQIALNAQEIDVIEQVVELKPELKDQTLVYMRVLVNRQIRLDERRIAELTGPLVAVCTDRR